MANKNGPILTQALLRDLFTYDGARLIRTKGFPNSPVGAVAHKIHKCGYVGFRVCGKVYGEHRLVWMYHYGSIPEYLDHINGNRVDNRMENLRPATASQNLCNSKLPKNNSSGLKGVIWAKDRKQWRVRITHNGVKKWVGSYDNYDKACEVSRKVRMDYHKQFANTGVKNV